MLIIDAININGGGGSVLLKYLLISLDNENIKYKVIVNSLNNDFPKHSFITHNGKYLFQRNSFLKSQVHKYNGKAILAFGNYPPGFKIEGVRVVTYVQNSLLSLGYQWSWFSVRDNILILLKFIYLFIYRHNSDFYCFQTNYTQKLFQKRLKLRNKNLYNLPFYDDTNSITNKKNLCVQKHTFIYISSSDPHKNHLNLLKAWHILLERNLKPILYLTLPPDSRYTKKLIHKIKYLSKLGCRIQNLGVLSRKESLDYLNKSEFCIYPSKIETIGLGIVEALFLEKKVICSNIDCLREIVSPSLTFDPNSPEEIAKSIITALTNSLPPSKILIENKIDDFVFLLKDISR